MTTVSIIMPVYNDADRLDTSITTVINQTLKDIELICVNDGSSDDSLKILNEFAEQYDFIKVLSQENQGSGKARNYGIGEASGEYIGFLDADDIFIENNALEKLYETAIENDANMVSGNIKLVDQKGKFSPFLPLDYYEDYNVILPEEYGIPWSFYKNIFKREFIVSNDISFPDLLRGQDPVFLAEILSKVDEIHTVPIDYYAYYYVDGANQCNTRKKRFHHMMHYKMVFDNFSDSRFDHLKHEFRYEMLDFIDLMGVDGGKDILDATREVFKDEPEIVRNFEENFYFKHEKHPEMQKLVNFRSNPEKPRISVLIPVYNASDFLNDSISGLLNQTFEDYELVCVNDGSKDNSLEILNDFAAKDNRVKVFDKPNGGCGSARNRALNEAKGDYIYFFDPDDEISKDALKETYKSAIYNDSDMVIFKANVIINDKISNERVYFNFDKTLKNRNFERSTFDYHDVMGLVFNGDLAPWSKLYKKNLLDSYDDFRFNEGVAFDDVPFHVKSMIRAKRMSFVNKCLYHYRLDNENSVNNTSSNGFDIFKIFDILEEFIKAEGVYDEFEYEFNRFIVPHTLFYIISTNSEEYYSMAREKFSKIDEKFVPKNNPKFNLVMEIEDYQEFRIQYLELLHNEEKNKLLKEINSLKKKNKKLKKENKKLKKEKNKYKKLNDELLNSRSWKITEPLRKLKRN